MIPIDTIPMKIANSFVLITLFNIIIDGRERAVTAIIKDNAVPIPTPFDTNASAIGSVPKTPLITLAPSHHNSYFY